MKRRKTLNTLAIGVLAAGASTFAATTNPSTAVYKVDAGVDFDVGNVGASHFVFNWTDAGGGSSWGPENDPTFELSIGETYTFERTSSAHPFVIMDNTAASFMTGSDGSYTRTTTNSADIDNATLKPIADFTSDPGGGDLITWTPDTIGDYWYTCTVTSHTSMAGKITVVPEPSSAALLLGTLAAVAGCFRRRRR